MKMVTVVCTVCGHEWTTPLYQYEEARDKQIPIRPINSIPCPKCGGRVEVK